MVDDVLVAWPSISVFDPADDTVKSDERNVKDDDNDGDDTWVVVGNKKLSSLFFNPFGTVLMVLKSDDLLGGDRLEEELEWRDVPM